MKAFRYFLVWFLLAIGVLSFSQRPIAGLVFLSWAVLLLPLTDQFAAKIGWSLKAWQRFGIILFGFLLIGLTNPRLQIQQTATSPTPVTTPIATASPFPPLDIPTSDTPSNLEQPTTPSPQLKEASFSATVEKKGLDFSYEAPGKVEETAQSIIVTYIRTKECGVGATMETATQEWQTIFDLASQTWTDKVKELSNCLGTTNQEWIDYSTTPSRFSIDASGAETVIRADAQDTDGSIIVENALVVRYSKP